MQKMIYCKTSGHNKLDFYLTMGQEKYFLFSQNYCNIALRLYKNGIPLERSLKSHCRQSLKFRALNKISEKIPVYIKYIEKEYNIAILNSSFKKCSKRNNKFNPYSDFEYDAA